MSSLGGIDFEKYKASILVGGLQGSICINYGSTAPMIIGFGNDLCDIRRIEASLARFGERFVQRCFTATERQKSDARAGRAASYAKRFAAKEACAKALGTGLCAGVGWRDTGVVNLPTGKPTLCLTVGAPMRWSCSRPAGVSVIRSPTIFASSLPRIFGL